jgi:TPR repeat protein
MRQSTNNPSRSNLHGVNVGTATASGPSGPVDGAWIQSAPAWTEARGSSRLWVAGGVGLGVLGCLALVAAGLQQFAGSGEDAACSSASDCNTRAAAILQAADVPEDQLVLAARMFQRACDQGHAAACNNLGLAHQSGEGVPVDHERARTAFQRACSEGIADACSNEGALYEHGLGVPVNLGDAQRLYFQACRRGSALGCSNLGALYAEGRGVVADPHEAARFFAEACSRGSQVGCTNLFASERTAAARETEPPSAPRHEQPAQ